ncbi:hypothetical protein C5167_012365, partial [Papaver somniferum]
DAMIHWMLVTTEILGCLIAPILPIVSILLQQTAIQASFHYNNVEIVESRSSAAELSSTDATQIGNNLSNLDQIYDRKDHSTKILVYMLVHLDLALRASMEEERARKDVAARTTEEKGSGQASSSHDTTMTENAGIMYDKANIGDLMASLVLVTSCPGVESVVRNMMQFMIVMWFSAVKERCVWFD